MMRIIAISLFFLGGHAALAASSVIVDDKDVADAIARNVLVWDVRPAHLMNFGAFATPEENILFDINDFDETLPGVDFTVDLKRLAASVAVAALAANFSNKRASAIAAEFFRLRRRQHRLRAALAGPDEGEFTEGHELDSTWQVPKAMVGRRYAFKSHRAGMAEDHLARVR